MSITRPIPTKIKELMETAFGAVGTPDAVFKAYYDGDPVYIPQQNLPCLIIDKQRTVVDDTAPTGQVLQTHTIVIQAEFDKRSEFNSNPDKVFLKGKLEEIAEGIDSETGEYADQTIAGVLQRNFTLGNLATGQNLDINYALIPRSQKGDLVTEVVSVTAVFEELIPISRS